MDRVAGEGELMAVKDRRLVHIVPCVKPLGPAHAHIDRLLGWTLSPLHAPPLLALDAAATRRILARHPGYPPDPPLVGGIPPPAEQPSDA